MTTIKFLQCDAGCGAKQDIDVPHGPQWYKLITIVASAEDFAALAAAAEAGEKPWDSGDFCSLKCLESWAGTQHELRAIEKDMEA